MHITSLPSPFGAGDIGPAAYQFVDWLADAGISVWQMLPIGPVGFGDSPYSSPSSFAIEPTLLSLDLLVEQGLLEKSDLKVPAKEAKRLGSGDCDFAGNRGFRLQCCAKAAAAFASKNNGRAKGLKQFTERTAHWLPAWLDFVSAGNATARQMHAWIQFELDRQWAALRGYCAKKGVALVGDVPIFVTADSADVRAHPELFRLKADGTPEVLTGVPPDGFSADGQLWGHPHYAWDAHIKQKFSWWTSRITCASERFDLVRIDHFIGFTRAYEVAAGSKMRAKACGVRHLVARCSRRWRSRFRRCPSSPRISARSRPKSRRCVTTSASPACASFKTPSGAANLATCRTIIHFERLFFRHARQRNGRAVVAGARCGAEGAFQGLCGRRRRS